MPRTANLNTNIVGSEDFDKFVGSRSKRRGALKRACIFTGVYLGMYTSYEGYLGVLLDGAQINRVEHTPGVSAQASAYHMFAPQTI